MQKIKLAALILSFLILFVTLLPQSSFANHRTFERRTRIVTPTKKVTPTPTPTKIVTPTPQPQGTDIKKTFIMDAINTYRISKGLSRVSTDSYTCSFAKTRAKEISSSFNHDGFRNRINNKSLPYPSYHLITENIALNSDYKKVVAAWIASSGHRENMEKDTPYICVESSGNYYAYEGWKP